MPSLDAGSPLFHLVGMTQLVVWAIPIVLFVAQLLLISVGYRHRRAPHDRSSNEAIAPMVTAGLSLMGLILAFSFYDAARRLDANRKTILDEANAIESVYMSVQLVEAPARDRMEETLRQYVDTRVHAYTTYEERMGLEEYERQFAGSSTVFRDLWSAAIEATPDGTNRSIILGALNTASAAAAARTLAMNTHLPPAVDLYLVGTVLVGALLVGSVLAQGNGPQWFYRVVFAATLSCTILTIVDMEYPRLAAPPLLRDADTVLMELRKSMK